MILNVNGLMVIDPDKFSCIVNTSDKVTFSFEEIKGFLELSKVDNCDVNLEIFRFVEKSE